MKVQLAAEDERVVERWMAGRGFWSPEEVVHFALAAIEQDLLAVEGGTDIDEAIREGLAELDGGHRISGADAAVRLDRRKTEWLAKQSLG